MAAPLPKPIKIYTPIFGVAEFSGRVIIKPLTKKEADEQGISTADYEKIRANAIAKIYNKGEKEGGSVVYEPKLDHFLITVPRGSTENDIAAEFLPTGEFNFVEPDYISFTTSTWPPTCFTDPRFVNGEQWAHNWLKSCEAWQLETGNPSIVVAVCDTGVDSTHPDLLQNRAEAWDMRFPSDSNRIRRENEGAEITDNQSHGTHCIGIVAANAGNTVGGIGVAPTIGHRSIKINDGSNGPGSASFFAINAGIMKAADLGDKVISVSWSFDANSLQSRTDAANYAKEKGALVFNSAGNSQTLRTSDLANTNLILVGSTAFAGTSPGTSQVRSSFSSYGPGVQIWGQGSSILSTVPVSMGSYSLKSGTSMACPTVAAVAGLIWSRRPSLTADEVKSILFNSGSDDFTYIGSNGQQYTSKVVNSLRAIQVADQWPNITPTPSVGNATPSPSISISISPFISPTTTPTPTSTVGVSSTPTPSPSGTPMATITPTPSISRTPSISPTPQSSQPPFLPGGSTTPTPTPGVSGTPRPSSTPMWFISPESPTPTPTPGVSGTPNITVSPSISPTITPSASVTQTVTPTPTKTPSTPTPTPSPTTTPASPTPTPSSSRINDCPQTAKNSGQCDPPFPPATTPPPSPREDKVCVCDVSDGLTGISGDFDNLAPSPQSTVTGEGFVVDVFVRKDTAESGTQLEDSFYMRWPAALTGENFYDYTIHSQNNCGFGPTIYALRGQWVVFRQQDRSNRGHPISITTTPTGNFDAGVLYTVTGNSETSGYLLYRSGDSEVNFDEYNTVLNNLDSCTNCPCESPCIDCCPNLAFRIPACAPDVLYYRHRTGNGNEIRGGKIVIIGSLPNFECETEDSCKPHERPWDIPLSPLSLGDTFYEWYTTTNNIISALDPLRIYDVKALGGLKELMPSTNGVLYLEADVGPGLRIFPPTAALNGYPQDCASGKIVLDIFGLPEVEVTGTVDPFEDRKSFNQVKETDLFVFERFVDDDGMGSRRGIDPHNTPAQLFKVKAENLLPYTIAGEHRFTGKISFDSPSMEIKATKLTIDDKAIELGASPFIEIDIVLVSGTAQQLVAGMSHDPDGDHFYYEPFPGENDLTIPGNTPLDYNGITGELIVQDHTTFNTYSRTEPFPPILSGDDRYVDQPYGFGVRERDEYLNRGPGFDPNDTDGAGVPIHTDYSWTPQYPELSGTEYSRATIVAVILTSNTTAKLRVRSYNDVPFIAGKTAYTTRSGVVFEITAISGQSGSDFDVNGGGIILRSFNGSKSILWSNTNDAWTLDQNLAIHKNYHILTPFNIANGTSNYLDNSTGSHNYWNVHQYLDVTLITGNHCLLSQNNNGLLNFAFVPVGVTEQSGHIPALSILPCGGIYIHNLDCSPQFSVRGGEKPNSIVVTNKYGVIDHTQQDRIFVALTGSATIGDFVVGDVVGIGDNNQLFLAKADNRDNAEVLGIVVKQITGGTFECVNDTEEGWLVAVGNAIDWQPGMCGLSSLKIGSVYFLSPITGGTLVDCEPIEVGQVRKPVAIATKYNQLLVTNYEGVVNGDYFQENPVLRLDDLRDVDAPITGSNSLQDGQILVWNGTTKMWENRNGSGSGQGDFVSLSVYETTVQGNNEGVQNIVFNFPNELLDETLNIPVSGSLFVCDFELCGSICYLERDAGGSEPTVEGWTYGRMTGATLRLLNSGSNSSTFVRWSTTSSNLTNVQNGNQTDGGYFNEFGQDSDGIDPTDLSPISAETSAIKLNGMGIWNTGSGVTITINRNNRTINCSVTVAVGDGIKYIGDYVFTARISNIRVIPLPTAMCGDVIVPSITPSPSVTSSPMPSITPSPSISVSPQVSITPTPSPTS